MDFYSKYDLNTSRTILYSNPKCCKSWKETSSLESDQLSQAELISILKSPNKQSNVQKESRGGTKHSTTVAFNVSTIKAYDYREEPTKECACRSQCYQSSDLVDRVRSLLDEIEVIKKNEFPRGKCTFCKRNVTTTGNCKRCTFLTNRYKISDSNGENERAEKLEIWLCKVKRLLYMILEREECKYQNRFSRISASEELVNLLRKLESPLTVREPEICSLENITESKDILEQVLKRLTSVDLKCEIEEKPLGEITLDKIETTTTVKGKGVKEDGMTTKCKSTISKDSMKMKEKSKVDKLSKEDLKSKEDQKAKREQKSSGKDKGNKVNKKIEEVKKGSQTLSKKDTQESEIALIRQLMKLNVKKKEHTMNKKKKSPPPNIIKIASLPNIVRKVRKDVIVSSDSFAECDRSDFGMSEMVKGENIVPIESRKVVDTGDVEPMLFKVHLDCSIMSQPDTVLGSSSSFETGKKKSQNIIIGKGAIRYALSDREFIKKGWTVLPTTKIMRRMNIYKMVPTHPRLDWFERHKEQQLVLYDTGEKFAEIQQDGCGKWFYKNGTLALEYYCSKDSDASHRYVVYSSCDDKDVGWRLPVTILAIFDHRGNGVVYDHYGNERLKYNQSKGIVIDEKIGPASKWKWHTLNDPPVLQKVFVENHYRPTGCMETLLTNEKVDETPRRRNEELNQAMLQIELENFMKEKANKLLEEFKPFHIKMKAVKLNDCFSLKVLDQANIYLMFRNGHTTAKLSVGMLLISNEIVDTQTAEVTKVQTPYDRHPPISRSIADIQEAIEKARKLGRARGKLRT